VTSRTLISITNFDNVGPENPAYPTTYKLKSCTLCDKEATKIVLFDMGNNIIAQQRFCDKHVKGIKK
jgi:hypothetical protein